MPLKKDLSVIREMRNTWEDINEDALSEFERTLFLKKDTILILKNGN